jgi:hypothetical protein
VNANVPVQAGPVGSIGNAVQQPAG